MERSETVKIFLTHGYFLSEDAVEAAVMKPYVPLGMLYVSAYLEKNGYANKVFDSTFSDFVSLKKELIESNPGVVGIYTNLMTKLNVLKIISLIKTELKLETKVILGGPEVRHHAENFLRHGADMIIAGEGEETMLEVCAHVLKNGELPHNTDGTILLTNGKLITNAERKLLKDLNDLPFPAREKIDLKNYLDAWKNRHGYSQLSVSTMRGCPYTCKWCSRAVYGGTYRRRSPKLVAEELRHLQSKYKPDRFWFVDDVFTISHKWLAEFCNEVRSAGLKISFEIITRADRMNEEVVKMLKAAGCFRIWIGAESGSQKIIDLMDRRVQAQQVREMIQLTRKHNMEAGTFIMLGYPGETKSDIKETIDHLIASGPDHYTITIAYPIKGTPLYTEIESKITGNNAWAQSTDRETDFSRTHKRKFYEYGVRWVYNSVEASRTGNRFSKLKLKTKSLVSEFMMNLVK